MSQFVILEASPNNRSDSNHAEIDHIHTVGRFCMALAPEPTVQGLVRTHASPWSVSKEKRLLDICAASFGLIVFSPLILLTALAVRMTSKGSIVFAQGRVGRHGKLFTLYKFRTMRTRSGLLWPSHTKYGDPRLTAVGGWLRKYKLDELPQIINVLLGDMSLVGPRPKMPGHESIWMKYRPGITGTATLRFRREEEMLQGIPQDELEFFYSSRVKPVKHKLDSEYMAKSTFSSDIAILVRTVIGCLLPGEPVGAFARSKRLIPFRVNRICD
jgi:lipopolysaccharide/colanic/teichoic acid biosynthesis glycosyltransferase